MTDITGDVPAGKLQILAASHTCAAADPLRRVHVRDDKNVTRLIALWGRDTPFIEGITIDWRFGDFSGTFLPHPDDRHLATAPERLVYAYEPDARGPFRQGIYAGKEWEAWTIAVPTPDVTSAEITVLTAGGASTVTLGCAIVRNGVVVCTNGPSVDTAHCVASFV